MMLIHHDEAALATAPQKELWAEYAAFNADAAEAYRVAIGLTTDEAVRAYLRDRLASLQQG